MNGTICNATPGGRGRESEAVLYIYLYIETFSMRSAVSVSVRMMPLGETVSVTFRNFLAPALACGYEKI